jgi:hypothetical protein
MHHLSRNCIMQRIIMSAKSDHILTSMEACCVVFGNVLIKTLYYALDENMDLTHV